MKSDYSIKAWLKKIFTVQKLSVVVGIIGVCVAILAYIHNLESSISIDIYDTQKEEFVDIRDYSIVITYFTQRGQSDKLKIFGPNQYVKYLPHFRNTSEKSLNNFKCDLTIISEDGDYDVEFDEEDISPDYKILFSDDEKSVIRYKFDVLHAQAALPPGIDVLDCLGDQTILSFEYNINYDGIDNPISVLCQLFIDQNGDGITEEKIRKLVKLSHDELIPYIKGYKKGKACVIVTDGFKFKLIKDVDSMSDNDMDNLNLDDIIN